MRMFLGTLLGRTYWSKEIYFWCRKAQQTFAIACSFISRDIEFLNRQKALTSTLYLNILSYLKADFTFHKGLNNTTKVQHKFKYCLTIGIEYLRLM